MPPRLRPGRPLMGLSTAKRNEYLDASVAPSLWLALLKSPPNDATTGAELDEAGYTGYARVQVASTAWTAASGGVKRTTIDIVFPPVSATPVTVVAWALCDAATAGTVVWWGHMVASRLDPTEGAPKVAAGMLTLSLTTA